MIRRVPLTQAKAYSTVGASDFGLGRFQKVVDKGWIEGFTLTLAPMSTSILYIYTPLFVIGLCVMTLYLFF